MSGGPSSLLAETLLDELDRDEMKELYEKYNLDHELFGYSVEMT